MKTTRQNERSFTLVEMIVAMGVLSILTFLLFSVLNETTRAISMSAGRTRVYTDLRVVVDQLSRDLQQSVKDNRYNCFYGRSNAVIFVATIDNKTGNEEAEVGYIWNSSNFTFCKSLQFSMRNSIANTNWEISEAQTNSGTQWQNTPKTNNIDLNEYVTILDNVQSVRFVYRDTNFATNTTWTFISKGSNLPAYVQTVISVCDPQDVIRCRGVPFVPTSRLRVFTNEVYVPRQQ